MGERLNGGDFVVWMRALAKMLGKIGNPNDEKRVDVQAWAYMETLDPMECDSAYMKQAVESFRSEKWPSVDMLVGRYFDIRAKQAPKREEKREVKQGCPKCLCGEVKYYDLRSHRPTKMQSAPCYYCHKGEIGPFQFLIQDKDRIAIASTELGYARHIAQLENGKRPEIVSCFKPAHASEELEDSFNAGPIPMPEYIKAKLNKLFPGLKLETVEDQTAAKAA